MAFGAFAEFLPGKEGLIHISQLASWHTKKVEDVVKEGDEVKVKVTEIDRQGRINLSMKATVWYRRLKNVIWCILYILRDNDIGTRTTVEI